MKRKELRTVVMLAAAAMLTTACTSSSDDNQFATGSEQLVKQNEPVALGFDVYTNRSTENAGTRAGVAGQASTTALQTGIYKNCGFGVFGYYTDNEYYARETQPNFMWNQQVTYSGSAFAYSPIVYWPNEYGSNAQSADRDKVSFFAYLPWVDCDPATGWVKAGTNAWQRGTDDANMGYGIISVSRNTIKGDPFVKYKSAWTTNSQVDLCWGVQPASSSWTTFSGTGATISEGMPWLNMLKPNSTTAKVPFTFKHALASLNVQIKATGDFVNLAATGAHKTRIYVRSVTFYGIAPEGALNLNNVQGNIPLWMASNATDYFSPGQSVTIYDGRADGIEGSIEGTALNETTLGLNPVIVQSGRFDAGTAYTAAANNGVGTEAVNLFGSISGSTIGLPTDVKDPIYVIPSGETPKVTIVYDVETAVDNLPGLLSDGETHGTTVENKITKTITGFTKYEAGKTYTITLQLGMNSVKVDATVGDWNTGSTANVDLPSN